MKEIIAEKKIEKTASDLSFTFINRRDNYAMQLNNGNYVSTHKPPTIELMSKHLKGEITLGSYILSEENYAKFSVFDADDEVKLRKNSSNWTEPQDFQPTSRDLVVEVMHGCSLNNQYRVTWRNASEKGY